jgi:hypothetical protein
LVKAHIFAEDELAEPAAAYLGKAGREVERVSDSASKPVRSRIGAAFILAGAAIVSTALAWGGGEAPKPFAEVLRLAGAAVMILSAVLRRIEAMR